jgi:transposase
VGSLPYLTTIQPHQPAPRHQDPLTRLTHSKRNNASPITPLPPRHPTRPRSVWITNERDFPYPRAGKARTASKPALAALLHPRTRFIPIKSEQHALLSLQRARHGYVCERTALVNRTRGLLAEFGGTLPKSVDRLRKLAPRGATPCMQYDKWIRRTSRCSRRHLRRRPSSSPTTPRQEQRQRRRGDLLHVRTKG